MNKKESGNKEARSYGARGESLYPYRGKDAHRKRRTPHSDQAPRAGARPLVRLDERELAGCKSVWVVTTGVTSSGRQGLFKVLDHASGKLLHCSKPIGPKPPSAILAYLGGIVALKLAVEHSGTLVYVRHDLARRWIGEGIYLPLEITEMNLPEELHGLLDKFQQYLADHPGILSRLLVPGGRTGDQPSI